MSCPDIIRSDGALIHQIATDVGCVPNDPLLFVQKFYGVGLGLIGGIGLLVIMYGAYVLMTSRGNSYAVQKGKEYIIYALIGIVLAVLGFVFLETFAVGIFHIPGFGA
jgi:hypothetical protein